MRGSGGTGHSVGGILQIGWAKRPDPHPQTTAGVSEGRGVGYQPPLPRVTQGPLKRKPWEKRSAVSFN